MRGYHWWNANPAPRSIRRAGALRSSTYMPSFPEAASGFWGAYGWQTAGALFVGVIGVLGWIFYARSLVVFGSGAFMAWAALALAVVCGFSLPIHYYRRYRMIRSFDTPEAPPPNDRPA